MCGQAERQKFDRRSFLVAGIAAGATTGALVTPAAAQTAAPGGQPDEATVNQIIQDWPESATEAAKAMIEKYGQPQEATPSRLIWFDNGPWLRTTVYKEEIPHDFPMPHKDVLEQVVPYGVAPDMFDELANYDGSVIVERTKGEIMARCDKEAANLLAINLANDILQGNKSVEEARQAYADAMQAMMQGNPPENTQKLVFDVPRDYAGDPGEAIMDVAEQQ
ncbi:hypothetical protein [Virgifigura deserti]|uniref:hypothetical protein n=1 Tax=Virgifigura deserti TaxID=2268457 RepID=UPI003CCC1243